MIANDKKVPPYVTKTSGNTKLNPKTLNIDGSEDQFYRYKMRQLFTQVVGNGKMIKTVLLNVDDVAKDLKIPPSYLTAYIGYETGAQFKYDATKPDRERSLLSGDFESLELSVVVRRLIQIFILCPTCRLPELTLEVKKTILATCRSCGARPQLPLRRKFEQFILKNPTQISRVEKTLRDKQDNQVKDSNTSTENTTSTTEQTTEPSSDINQTDSIPATTTSSERRSKNKQPNQNSSESKVVWSVDTSDDAVQNRRKNLLPTDSSQLISTASGNITSKKSINVDELINSFKQMKIENPTINLFDEIWKLKNVSRISDVQRLIIYYESIFEPTITSNNLLANISKFVTSTDLQLTLLNCIETSCGTDEKLAAKALVIVKNAYDDEIIEEDAITSWYNAITNQYIKKALLPLIDWLKTAEEEEENEEEAEEEEEGDE
eukprot:TRINITY_DN2094_c0_g1_i1.p1 TRINITY_DN2094_c0_g1~~TRINITY_DN2094_c0_g1_i1.p1  ORF type:complete len:435 (-),score=235.87 TRINITY_DN2094_c0_g1_i1:109-1413(-)